MSLEILVARYGLWAILFGAGIEGEAVVIAGGILAHEHVLPLWGVAAAAAIGSCAVDQAWFWLGRRYRDSRLVARARSRPAFARAVRLLERHPIGFTLGFRFVYGLRTVSPIAIGASTIPARTFVPLNIVAAAIWGPAIAGLGYLFGKSLDPWLRDLRSGTTLVIGALALVPLCLAFGKAALARRG